MLKIDKKTGLITTDDGYQILFHGNNVEVSKNSKKLSLIYERLVGGSIVIYKNESNGSKELLDVLDKTLKEMKFSYEII